jgi:hypothetical protein
MSACVCVHACNDACPHAYTHVIFVHACTHSTSDHGCNHTAGTCVRSFGKFHASSHAGVVHVDLWSGNMQRVVNAGAPVPG